MAVGFAVGSLGAFAGTAAAESERSGSHADPQASWEKSYKWSEDDRDEGGINISEGVRKNREMARAEFWAYGERLEITDNHDNGRQAIAKLWVGGSGPAIFYANEGDKDAPERRIDLSFAEGQSVQMQVCTSDSSNAVCTDKETYTGVT